MINKQNSIPGVFLILVFIPSLALADQGPVMVTEPKEFKFGKILSGELINRKIKLSNVGDQDLIVKSIDFTCGCTIPKILLSSGKEVTPVMEKLGSYIALKPNEWAEIKLQFQTIGRFGNVKHRMDIFTNNPYGQVAHIPIVAEVTRAFTLSPHSLDFGLVDRGVKTTKTVRVESSVGPFEILGLKESLPCLTYSTEEVKDADKPTKLLNIVFTGNAKVGKLMKRLKVHVKNEKVSDFALFTEMQVFPPIVFTQNGERIFSDMDLGILKRGEEKKFVLQIKSNDKEKPFRIIDLFCKTNSGPKVKAELIKEKPGELYQVVLTVSPEKVKKRMLRGNFTLVCDYAEMSSIRIRFHGMFSKKKK